MRLSFFAVPLLLLPLVSHADGYFGLSLGEFDYDETGDGIVVLGDIEDSTSSFGLYGGFAFNQYFAIEGAYSRTSDIEESVPMSLPIVGVVPVAVSARYEISSLRAVGFVPVAQRVRLLGGIGVTQSRLDGSGAIPAIGNIDVGSDADGTGALLGVQVDAGRAAIRLRYEAWSTESNLDVSELGIAVAFKF
jgi:OmpA-OmpF porin, OOP family